MGVVGSDCLDAGKSGRGSPARGYCSRSLWHSPGLWPTAAHEGDSQCLLGSVLEAQGKLTEALAAFEESLAISRRLAEQDPNNAGWQSDLAAAHNRVGGVLQAQGKLTEAMAAFKESLAISRRLAEQDPSNAGWQSDLAAAHNRVGGVLEAQGKLTEARQRLRRPWRSAGGWPSKTRATRAGNRIWR